MLKISKISTIILGIISCLYQYSYGAEIKMQPLNDNKESVDTGVMILDSDIISITPEECSGFNVIKIRFNKEGALINGTFTRKYQGDSVKFFINGEYISTTKIMEPSDDSFVIMTSQKFEVINKFKK